MSDYSYDAMIVEVHDGDTVTLDVDLGFAIWHRGMRIRLYGINAPELDTDAGKQAQIFLRNLLPVGSKVMLFSIKDRADKFGGRWLGTIRLSESMPDSRPTMSVNELIVSAGHAKHWDGTGKKPV